MTLNRPFLLSILKYNTLAVYLELSRATMVPYKRDRVAVTSPALRVTRTLSNMKTSPFLIGAVASLMPTLAMGLVGISWSVPNVTTSGLRDISFPFSISNALHKSGYYIAQQFKFVGRDDIGYIGLRLRPDSGGKPVIHPVALFPAPPLRTGTAMLTPAAGQA